MEDHLIESYIASLYATYHTPLRYNHIIYYTHLVSKDAIQVLKNSSLQFQTNEKLAGLKLQQPIIYYTSDNSKVVATSINYICGTVTVHMQRYMFTNTLIQLRNWQWLSDGCYQFLNRTEVCLEFMMHKSMQMCTCSILIQCGIKVGH